MRFPLPASAFNAERYHRRLQRVSVRATGAPTAVSKPVSLAAAIEEAWSATAGNYRIGVAAAAARSVARNIRGDARECELKTYGCYTL